MNAKLRKLRSLVHCPVCTTRYDQSAHLPLLMPCGKSVCESCVQSNLSRNRSFWCPFCSAYHQQPSKQQQFPFNEALVYLTKNDSSSLLGKEQQQRSDAAETTSISAANSQLKEILDEIDANSADLDKAVYKSAHILKATFDQVENQINDRFGSMIDQIQTARNKLIQELSKHQKSVLSEENSILKTRQELKITQTNLTNLLSNCEPNDDTINRSLLTQAQGINKRLLKLKEEALNWSKVGLKFEPSVQPIEIGIIVVAAEASSKPAPKPNVKFVSSDDEPNQLHPPHYLTYKIPSNSTNFQIGFVPSTKALLKVSEFADIEDFSFRINIQLVDKTTNNNNNKNSATTRSRTLQIESFRLKRIECNVENEYFVILLRNHFSNSSKRLLLINATNLELTSRIDFTSTYVCSLHMTPTSIYVINKNGPILKYVYPDGLLSQSSENPNNGLSKANVVGFYANKVYYVDVDKGKVRLHAESSGELVKLFELSLNGEKDWIIKVDSLGRINMLNKSSFQLYVYSTDGDCVLEKKFHSARLKSSIDLMFMFNDSTYSFVDLKNRSIHFF